MSVRVPPFQQSLVPWLGFVATIVQIGFCLAGGFCEIGLMVFTGGLMGLPFVAGGGEKG